MCHSEQGFTSDMAADIAAARLLSRAKREERWRMQRLSGMAAVAGIDDDPLGQTCIEVPERFDEFTGPPEVGRGPRPDPVDYAQRLQRIATCARIIDAVWQGSDMDEHAIAERVRISGEVLRIMKGE